MTTVSLRQIDQAFGTTEVLSGLNLDIESGEYAVVLGPSGCGKTTILRLIAGLQKPNRGKVLLGGETVNEIPPRLRDVSMVFQGDTLYPHLTVHQSLRFGLQGKHNDTEIEKRVTEAVELTKIAPIMNRMPDRLSGGERRRAAIANAIAQRCSVRLLDEPLSALDVAMRNELQDDILRWHSQTPGTSIHVTHDGNEAMRMADRIAILDNGRVAQFATPNEVYAAPATVAAALSIGTPAMNMIPAKLIDGRIDADSFCVSMNVRSTDPVSGRDLLIGVRAEDLTTQEVEQFAIYFSVNSSKCRSAGMEVHCDLGGRTIVALSSNVDLGGKTEVVVGASESSIHFFDAVSGKRLTSLVAASPPR